MKILEAGKTLQALTEAVMKNPEKEAEIGEEIRSLNEKVVEAIFDPKNLDELVAIACALTALGTKAAFQVAIELAMAEAAVRSKLEAKMN